MKKYLSLRAIVFLISFILFILAATTYHSGKSQSFYKLDNPAYGLNIEDSTSYIEFKRMRDSVSGINYFKKVRISASGSGFSFGPIGFSEIEEGDTLMDFDKKEHKITKYYFTLNDYRLRENDKAEEFFEEKNYYLPSINKNVKQEARFRMSTQNPGELGEIMFPISGRSFSILNVSVGILAVLLVVCFLYIVIIRPIAVLQHIALGNAFQKENYIYLKWAGLFMLLFGCINFLIGLLLSVLLKNSIPPDLEYPILEILMSKKAIFLIGIIFLVVSSAFKKGYQLQIDKDLTI